MDYRFTVNWFLANGAKENFDFLIKEGIVAPKKILEIGSYEGMSICYLIELLKDGDALEIHCIDAWEKTYEHQVDMKTVEENFINNLTAASSLCKNKPKIYKHKGESFKKLNQLYFNGGKNYFDFIYIDGSHLPEDVLADAVMSFKLLKSGGIMIFDDYNWESGTDKSVNKTPKIAIDAFSTVYFDFIKILSVNNGQMLIQKK